MIAEEGAEGAFDEYEVNLGDLDSETGMFTSEILSDSTEEKRDSVDDIAAMAEFDIHDSFEELAGMVQDPLAHLVLPSHPTPTHLSQASDHQQSNTPEPIVLETETPDVLSPAVVTAQASPVPLSPLTHAQPPQPPESQQDDRSSDINLDKVQIIYMTLDELVADFYARDSTSKLKEKKNPKSNMPFFVKNIPTNSMVIELIEKKVLHKLIVLDHIARRIDESPLRKDFLSVMGDFKHNKEKLNGAFSEYLENQLRDKVLVLRHFKPDTQTQAQMVEEEMGPLLELLRDVKGYGHTTHPFYQSKTDRAVWLDEVCGLLRLDAQRVDKELVPHAQPGRLVMFSEHLSRKLNLLVVLLNVHAKVAQINKLELQVVESRRGNAALQSQLHHVDMPPGIIVSTVSGSATPETSNEGESAAIESGEPSAGQKRQSSSVEESTVDKRARPSWSPSFIADTMPPTPSSDTAYWVRIDPQYLAGVEDRSWCQPGMPVGIYPTGAGPPSCLALFICVVTSKPTFLELPQPFAGAGLPQGLYLKIALAVGVLGRVPLRMTDSVLERFWKAGVSQELFWARDADGQEYVDFAEAGRPFNYKTAKYIGFADYDEARLADGKVTIDFQDVPGVPVMVAYRAVSETQIFKRIDAVEELVVQTKTELEDKIKQSEATTDEKIRDLRTILLRRTSSGFAPDLLRLLLFLVVSALAFWYVLQQAAPTLPPPVTTSSINYSRMFKNGTTVSSALPSVPTDFFLRTYLRGNITHTMFNVYHKSLNFPELPTPVVVVAAPGGYGKSTEVLSLVHQREVYKHFTGGVYYLECSYHLGDEMKLLALLAKQLFGSFMLSNDRTELVASMNHAVASQGQQILVVLDNVGTTQIVQSVASIVGDHGVVLITSRRRDLHHGAVLTDVHELEGQELIEFMESHGVQVNGTNSANIDAVIARTHGVPLALSLVSKLHVTVGMPWEQIAMRVDARFGEIDVHGVESVERLGITGAFHNSTFACIAVSIDALSEHLREKLVPLVLLPIGIQVAAPVVSAMWGIPFANSHLKSLFDHSLVVYDAEHGVVRLHDLVREYLEDVVRTDVTHSIAVHTRYESLISYMMSPTSTGPLVAKFRDLNAEVGVYYRHWDYLARVLHPGSNTTVLHLTPFEHVHAHTTMLQTTDPYSLQRCKYAYGSSLVLRVLGKATSEEIALIEQAINNIDEVVAENEAPYDEIQQLRACQAELIDKYADLIIQLPNTVIAPLQKREKQLQWYLRARELKKETIGSETREYTRTLNSIGLVIEQILVLHKESHGEVTTFNASLLQLANASYTESLDILSRLIVEKKADWMHVGVVYNNLANMQSKLENYHSVEPLLLQAIEFYRRPLVYLEPSNTCADLIVNAEANIGINCYYMGDYARAKAMLTKARDYFIKRFYPSSHVYMVKTTKHLKLIEEARKSDRAGL